VKSYKVAFIVALPVIILLTMFCGSAYAITGNYQLDSTPYVGVVVFFNALQQPICYCSGTLISPTVMLTAGHGTYGASFAVVCFDQGPFSYSIQNGELTYYGTAPLYTGVTITYPSYALNAAAGAKAKDALSVSDLGVVILDRPVQGVTKFPTLPTVNFDDKLSVGTSLKIIGYGVNDPTAVPTGGLTSWDGTLARNSAQVQLLSDHFAGHNKYIRCTTDPSHGRGGVSFGDSGGPVLYRENGDSHSTLLAIHAYVDDNNNVSYHTRIDTPQVLNWIRGFVGSDNKCSIGIHQWEK